MPEPTFIESEMKLRSSVREVRGSERPPEQPLSAGNLLRRERRSQSFTNQIRVPRGWSAWKASRHDTRFCTSKGQKSNEWTTYAQEMRKKPAC
jgi:hypothetical protein